MTEIPIYNKIYGAYKLNHINNYLSTWDLNPVEGQGLYYGARTKYGHVKIKMYKSTEDESTILWNLTQQQLPDGYGAKETVKEVLSFFLSYFEGIRGEAISLTFEINDGSYHAVDSRNIAYGYATIHALISCFDKEIIPFRETLVIRNR